MRCLIFLSAILSAIIWASLAAETIAGATTTTENPSSTTTEGPLPELAFSTKDVEIVKGNSKSVNLTLSAEPSECVNITFSSTPKILSKHLMEILVCPNTTTLEWEVTIDASENGKTIIWATADPTGVVNDEEAFVRLSIMVVPGLNTFGDVLGWIYTIAWDISFLPQIYHNWRRKSVVGLAFDFLTFNFLGFFCYFLFNMGNLWIPEIQEEFHIRNPTSVMHVRLNDVIFPLYALICTILQIIQCFIYKREPSQRVSMACRIISGVLLLSCIIVLIIVASTEKFLWLDLLYWLSYVKIAITCVKYTPQLYMNYKLKSTEGWSIWQVILDCTGGTLSLVQMFLLAGNYNDWNSVLTDPAKLGLGLLSIFFNIFFFMQHYWLYRGSKITEDDTPLKSVEDIEKSSRKGSMSSKSTSKSSRKGSVSSKSSIRSSRKGSVSSKSSELKGETNPDPASHM